jgi:hypothetical protein
VFAIAPIDQDGGGYTNQPHAFPLWPLLCTQLQHFLKYGETLHETNRQQLKAIRKKVIQEKTTFNAKDDATPRLIINHCPQYSLDKILQALQWERSK